MPQTRVECRFCSDLVTLYLSVILNLFASKGRYLMMAMNYFSFLDFGFHILRPVRGFFFQFDGFA
jgi:hypothetical protein